MPRDMDPGVRLLNISFEPDGSVEIAFYEPDKQTPPFTESSTLGVPFEAAEEAIVDLEAAAIAIIEAYHLAGRNPPDRIPGRRRSMLPPTTPPAGDSPADG